MSKDGAVRNKEVKKVHSMREYYDLTHKQKLNFLSNNLGNNFEIYHRRISNNIFIYDKSFEEHITEGGLLENNLHIFIEKTILNK